MSATVAGTPPRLSDDRFRRLRFRAQHLATPAPRRALDVVVRDVVGIQAQMPRAAALSLRARVAGLTLEDVRRALEERRTLVRTWVMRGTIHIVRAEDLPWMLGALPASVVRSVPRWLERRAGLVPETAPAAAREVARVVTRRGPLTRSEIVEALGLSPEAGVGLTWLAAQEGRICFGPDRGSEQTFVAVRRWLPDLPRPAPPAAGLLGRRYLAGYGPAEAADLATWWGCTLGEARSELAAARAIEVDHRGTRLLALDGTADASLDRPARPVVRLVGAWDAYLLGHRDRGLILDPARARRVNRGGGWVHPVVLVDGRVAGVWRTEVHANRLRIEVERFRPIPRPQLREEADDVGRFLGRPVEVAGA
jgi:Winged helix DNA-binding domain